MALPFGAVQAVAPSREERLLAALAHLACFAGLALTVPIALYALKRKESRFVAFHAAQGALLGALVIGSSFALTVLAVALGGGLSLMAFGPLPQGTVALWNVRCVLPWLACFGFSAAAGVRAFQGRTWSIPLIGRLAERVLAGDDGVPPRRREGAS